MERNLDLPSDLDLDITFFHHHSLNDLHQTCKFDENRIHVILLYRELHFPCLLL